MTRIGNCWLGGFFRIEHTIVVRTVAGSSAGLSASPWMLPLKDVPDSCCVFWETTTTETREHTTIVEPTARPACEPIVKAVWDLEARAAEDFGASVVFAPPDP